MGTVHPARFIELDTHFHRVIHVAARNGLLLALLDGVGGLAERSRDDHGAPAGPARGDDPLARRDLRRARARTIRTRPRAAMLEHLDEIREVLTRLLELPADALTSTST